MNTIVVCIDYNVLTYDAWNTMSLAKSEVIIVMSLFCNTMIAVKVLPLMRKSLGWSSITVEALFMLSIFEVIMCYRMVIIGFQSDLKHRAMNKEDGSQTAWYVVMITYFSCCEMVLYCFLIFEIMHQVCTISKASKAHRTP